MTSLLSTNLCRRIVPVTLLVILSTLVMQAEEPDAQREADENSSQFNVTCEGGGVIPSRRLSYSVGFKVVETIHDAFADDKTEYASGAEKRSAQAKRGSPVHDKIGARIYAHADMIGEESSIVRLLKFFGQGTNGRLDGDFDIDKEEVFTLTVQHADATSAVRWTLEDADGNRVTLLPYKKSR